MKEWMRSPRPKRIAPVAALLFALVALPAPAAASAPSISVEPVAHLNGCIYRTEFQRGDQAVWLITVTDPATGEPITQGIDVIVQAGDRTLRATYNASQRLWATSLPLVWDLPTGTLKWSVSVTDASGVVTQWQPGYSANQTITIAPGPVKVETAVTDPVSGQAVGEIRPGDTVRITSKVTRPTHGDLHSYGVADREITGTIPDRGAAVKGDATVKALIGQGAFTPTKAAFAGGTLTELPLSFDAAREAWTATFTVPKDAPHGTYSVAVLAEDRYGNKGQTLVGALPLVIPVVEPGPLDGPRGVLAGGALAVLGIAAGLVIARRRPAGAGTGASQPARPAPSTT